MGRFSVRLDWFIERMKDKAERAVIDASAMMQRLNKKEPEPERNLDDYVKYREWKRTMGFPSGTEESDATDEPEGVMP